MRFNFSPADSSAKVAGAPSMGLNAEMIEDCLGPLFPLLKERAEANKSPEGDWRVWIAHFHHAEMRMRIFALALRFRVPIKAK